MIFYVRSEIIEFLACVKGAGCCIVNNWILTLLILIVSWSVYERTFAYYRDEVHGQLGGTWYRYFPTGCDCDFFIEQKTIADVIKGVIDSVEPNWFSDNYCITITHNGTWHGTLLVGSSPSTITASCLGAHKGSYETGSRKLTAPWSSNSPASTQ